MTLFSRQELKDAHVSVLKTWSAPNKNFTSGFDARSSDNALLTLMWGGLHHAQQNDWLNAGRRLIDKTYVQILIATQGLSSIPFLNAEHTAATLDNFIRQQVAPRWSLINNKQKDDKSELAADLISSASCSLFGSLESEVAASHLLFFLCPVLPIIPFNHNGQYSSHIQYCQEIMKLHQPDFDILQTPAADFGKPEEINLVNRILSGTDWWHRNILKTLLSIHSQ